LQKNNVSKAEVRLAIQTMIDTLLRMSGYIYDTFFILSGFDFGFESIIDYSLVFLANAINAYIYLMFNAYVSRQNIATFFYLFSLQINSSTISTKDYSQKHTEKYVYK
jgi:hypothetical protein